jgi:multidrug efflux pump subunit AcrB
MLSGIVVNAGIYVTTAYKQLGGMQRTSPKGRVGAYVRAFRYKAVPISLTVLSTVLGLLPFLSDGPKEVFWFDFAVGTISGLAFSILALVLLLPVFVVKRA